MVTLWADFADLLHIVFGAVIDGVSNTSLNNDLMFRGRRCAEYSHILHGLTQLGSSDTHTTYRCAKKQHKQVTITFAGRALCNSFSAPV